MFKYRKHTWFLIGILVGLTVGVFLARKFLPNKDLQYINIDFKKSETISKSDSINKSKLKKTNSKSHNNSSSNRQKLDSNRIDSSNILQKDSIYKDSLLNLSYQDSSYKDTIWSWEDTINIDTTALENNNLLDSEDSLNSKLLKDELFDVKYIIPYGNRSNFECEHQNNLDSILVDNYQDNNQKVMRVEFWKSPLNYRAYILTKNKLVLFGILKPDQVKLSYQSDGKLKLEYYDLSFELFCSKNLKPTILK